MTAMHPLQQINFTDSFNAYVIEASAGTGKTWTIERLYIKALLEASNILDVNSLLNVENILVVTFTNDATHELKERLYTQLEKSINIIIYLHNHGELNTKDIFTLYLQSRQDQYKKDVVILTRALQNFDQAAIFTIHGFCNKILHDYQFECQTNSEFELVTDNSEVLKQIVFNFLRTQIFTAAEFSGHIDTVMNNLYDFFNGNYTLSLVDRIVNKLPKDLFKIEHDDYVIKYQLEAVSNINFLAHEILEDKAQYKARFLAYLINYIYQYYPRQNKQKLSYDELIGKMADSVANSEELADKIFYKYPIAFIDEFQDTDLLQWQIFSNIYHLKGSGHSTIEPRGNVVVVGDPKQAIYSFRGADVDTYIEARAQIKRHLNLVNNYRSHANIMNFINQLFDLTNQRSEAHKSYLGDGINYTHITASTNNLPTQIPSLDELSQIYKQHNIEQKIYTEEVQLVAIKGVTKGLRNSHLLMVMTFEILTLLNANPNLKGKIAVLVTKNREAMELVKYFANFGIKAAELKLGNIYATTTAHELNHILISLSDLANRQNFIRALTTKIFNISLVLLADRQNNQLFEIWHQRFSRYAQIWASFGIFSLIYAILEDVILDKNSLSNRELANIWQLAELLNRHHQKINNNEELLFWFKEKIKEAADNQMNNTEINSEELIRLENDDEQIIITTQHKAKGLEYDILFCPYFKNNITLDGPYDFNYKRPFFSNYRKDAIPCSELITESALANSIVERDNKEVHRLNYVALTRAKSRIYIYLKQNTITRSTGKYNSKEKPDKLIELFGYVKSNPQDNTHPLFNYSEFFGDNPGLAIKEQSRFPGVVVYNRDNLLIDELYKLRLNSSDKINSKVDLAKPHDNFSIKNAYFRQSYSGLTKSDEFDKSYDYYEKISDEVLPNVTYRYEILTDKNLSGAVFGTLFHELCEVYPFSQSRLERTLKKYNATNTSYPQELTQMIEEAFSYPLLDGKALRDFTTIVHELEFNITVDKNIQFHKVISKYFGFEHPFSIASQSLGEVRSGFLIGFMDVCFEHDGKYWVLDYKTNTLSDYSGTNNPDNGQNPLVQSMAEHHYYLQYLLYLVALKRYLQVRLKVADATSLIGGAVYYYVRGIYVAKPKVLDGIFIDDKCQKLVNDLDRLL